MPIRPRITGEQMSQETREGVEEGRRVLVSLRRSTLSGQEIAVWEG